MNLPPEIVHHFVNLFLGQDLTHPWICNLTYLSLRDEAGAYFKDVPIYDMHESDDDDSTHSDRDDNDGDDMGENGDHSDPNAGNMIKEDIKYTAQVVAFMKQNKNLSEIAVKGCDSRLDWGPIFEHCPSTLKALTVIQVTLTDRDMQRFFAFGPQLSKLGIIASSIFVKEAGGAPGSFTLFPSGHGPTFPNLVQLTIDNVLCEFDMPAWISNCPEVKSLTWNYIAYTETKLLPSSSVPWFTQTIKAPIWSQIQSLQLSFPLKGLLTDARIAQVLDGCAPLTACILSGSEMWLKSMDSLKRHYPTLERVNMTECPNTRSWMYQAILTSCSKLRDFSAGTLDAAELVTTDDAMKDRTQILFAEMRRDLLLIEPGAVPRDMRMVTHHSQRDISKVLRWVCVGLQSLKLGIKGVKDGWDQQIFAQISKLERLKELDVSVGRGTQQALEDRGLDFRLQSGLGLLETIKWLTKVKFDDCYQENQDFGSADHAWLLEQWPYLTMVNDVPTGFRL
ncbi:hypothetical protein EMPS_00077 [Entomortierella parvispora]|uniref:F-box domain-containing protein n=1 Tax=Entomortierella parvispora TaxID=205924 RepID=A0A9P3GZ54_9FUNG|nr:hypothetical protein EMPS_00077 [Entomortierella parvispora]